MRSAADQANAIYQVCCTAIALGWEYRGLTWSPLVGPAGNIEYLLWLGVDSPAVLDPAAIALPVDKERITILAEAAQRELANPASKHSIT